MVILLVGFALTIGAPALALRRAGKERAKVKADMDKIEAVARDESLDHDETRKRQTAVREPTSSWLDVLYVRERIFLAISDADLKAIRRDLGVAGIGVVLITIASVWSLWL